MFIFPEFLQSIFTAIVEFAKSRRRHKSDTEIDRDSQVITLTDLNAKSVLSTRNVDIFVEFYAPWCVHCQQLKPELRSTANAFKNVSFSKLSSICLCFPFSCFYLMRILHSVRITCFYKQSVFINNRDSIQDDGVIVAAIDATSHKVPHGFKVDVRGLFLLALLLTH